jgi:hypothetical protein
MGIATRPMLVFEPVSYGIAYNPSGGNEPDAEGWTLIGTDHASVSGGKLVITGGGADATSYSTTLEALTATGIVFAKAQVRLSSSVTDAWITIQSATLGVELPLQLSAREIEHDGDIAAVDLTTLERTVTVFLGASGYVVRVDGSEVLAGTPDTYVGANELAIFGKGTVDDAGTQTWGIVQCSTAETFIFSYPPNGWNVNVYTTEKHVNVSQNGTVDTIHYRDDNDLSFRSIAHTDAEVDTLSAHYSRYMAPGRVFYITPDFSDVSTVYSVKMLDKKFAPVASASTPMRKDISWHFRVNDDAEPIVMFEEEMEDMLTLEVNSTTPSIAGASSWTTANTAATTITSLVDGRAGKVVTLLAADANTTIHSGLTATGMTIPLIAGDTLQWVYTGAAWKQIGGSVGMGRYVPLAEPDSIGDWIATNVTAATDVDVSDDSVRKGACSVVISYVLSFAGNTMYLYARKNGSTGTTEVRFQFTGATGDTYYIRGQFVVGLDNNAIFEAWHDAAVSSSTAKVHGYYI